ncbi:Nuclear envelope integral membrane protein 1 [Trichoplax sp. H2]|nr:Nuclear envelope integral membrane protein 1 [Trichoplax sp. H2]|eukprot:RDD40707.1 Nuclear envelope integral membrane protein 1 [Trichoplax sp. H2]
MVNAVAITWNSIALMITGITFLLTAEILCKNRFFYYLIGISCGILIALLIIVHYLSGYVPQKSLSRLVLVSGFFGLAYFTEQVVLNFPLIINYYWRPLVIYLGVAGIISFFVCYLYEPPKVDRKRDILKWIIQLLGLVLIYNASYSERMGVGIVVACCVMKWYHDIYSLFMSVLNGFSILRKYLPRYTVPEPRRLLTEAEYEIEGKIATDNALLDLRRYCLSSECNSWELISKLKDPKSFAKFLCGEKDLNDDTMFTWMNDSMFELEENTTRTATQEPDSEVSNTVDSN